MRLNGQRKILLLCWLTYTLAYTLRVNIAVVIPVLVAERGYTYTQMGLVTSLFFITYMSGQLASGYLGDRVSSKLMIITGLVLSAAFNIGLVLSTSLLAVALCWALNGLAQSMLWAPIIKTLTVWFTGRQLEKVSFVMSISMVIGYALSWGTSSMLTTYLDWRLAFYLPAGLVLLQAFLMLLFFHSQPIDRAPVAEKTAGPTRDLTILSFFRLIHLPGLLLIAVAQGMIREGISVWFPTILQNSGRLPAKSPWVILIILPILNLGGILFVRRISLLHQGDSTRTLHWIFGLITGTAILMAVLMTRWPWLILTGMILLLPLSYGLTPILTSVIPFQYAQFRWVSLTAGVLDFAIYMGAAISGLLSGVIADHYAWNGVVVLWLGAAFVGTAVSHIRFKKNKGRKRHEQTIHHPS